jgi:hypothetical protein
MTQFIFFIIILTVLIIVILLSKIIIVIEYKRKSKDDIFVVSFFLYNGLIKYKYEIPSVDAKKKGIFYRFIKKAEGEEGKKYTRYTNILNKIESGRVFYLKHRCFIKRIQNFLKCKITLKNLNFNMNFGTGNACQTSILTGILWTFCGVIISFLHQFIKIEKKQMVIKPNYKKKSINLDLYCIFNVRIVYIIVIGFMILTHFTKDKFPLFKTERCVSG